MAIEKTVHFLNIDLMIGGTFDRKSLVRALGHDVFALHERVQIDGLDSLVVELNVPNLDLTSTLDRLLGWVQGLPRPARREWDRASRRTFDIGLAAGKHPHCSTWTVSPGQVAALAKLGAEVAITLYGADHGSPQRTAPEPRRPPPRGRKAGRLAPE